MNDKGPATEQEMVDAFLRAEQDSDRTPAGSRHQSGSQP